MKCLHDISVGALFIDMKAALAWQTLRTINNGPGRNTACIIDWLTDWPISEMKEPV